MLDIIFIALAVGLGGSGGTDSGARSSSSATSAATYTAEPQDPSGRFTTATEVRPILGMTRPNWVSVREYEGQDLVYFTHLLAWRCGLHEIRYGINGGPMQVWDMPPCLTETNAPNAIRTEDGLPYITQPLGSVTALRIELLYDDLSEETAEFQRKEVLMP